MFSTVARGVSVVAEGHDVVHLAAMRGWYGHRRSVAMTFCGAAVAGQHTF